MGAALLLVPLVVGGLHSEQSPSTPSSPTAPLTTAAVPRPTVDPASGLSMVTIGRPGNPPDTNGLGSVAEPFRIGAVEVTNAQYVAFLNAVAADDPLGLYDSLMTSSDRGGIERAGAPGSWTYSLKSDFGMKPVNGTTWVDSARFCNWLHNGKPSGAQGPSTTEDGAYDLAQPLATIMRRPGARYFLPTHDEWYKAAYYDPFHPAADAGGTPDYWFYPTRSDLVPLEAQADAQGGVTNPGPNVANSCRGAVWNGEVGNVTSVGDCGAPSPWGAFDLGGNVNEVTETPGTPIDPNTPTRRIRGGDFANSVALLGSPAFLAGSLNMQAEGANIGFRVAARAPTIRLEVHSSGPRAANLVLLLEGARPLVPLLLEAALDGRSGARNPALPLFLGMTDAAGEFELQLPPACLPSGRTLEFRLRFSGEERGASMLGLSLTLP